MSLPSNLTALVPATGGMRLDVSSITNACGFATNGWHIARIVVSDLTGTGGTLVVEGSQNKGDTWSPALSLGDINNGGRTSSIVGNGDFAVVCADYTHVRVRPSVAGSGAPMIAATGVAVDGALMSLLGSSGGAAHASAFYRLTLAGPAAGSQPTVYTIPALTGAPIPSWATKMLAWPEIVPVTGAVIRFRSDNGPMFVDLPVYGPTILGRPMFDPPIAFEGAATLAALQVATNVDAVISIEFRP